MESQESELYKLFKNGEYNENVFTIGTTVDTGLEWQALDECKEKIEPTIHVVKERGKIYFNIEIEQFKKVQEMRSIDNIFIISDVRNINFKKENADEDLELIKNTVNDDIKLEKGLNLWKSVTNFLGKIYPEKIEFNMADKILKSEKKVSENNPVLIQSVNKKGRKRGRDPSLSNEDDILKYRVTCERTGSHSFQSGQVARVIGGELQDKYNWLVDLTMYHLEIVCNLSNNQLITSLRVTHESKHRRNIVHFGPTTLRATVSYSLLRLANPKSGDIVMDPMCGGGSIPIEAGIAFPNAYIISGDNHDKAVSRAKLNIDAQSSFLTKIELIRWSVTDLPLKDSYVDVVVTDMPFGKRSGNMSDNRVLYKKYIFELARVVKIGTGRLVLMTYDRRSIQLALQKAANYFKVTKMLGVNMGGLHAAVYVLKRTKLAHDSKIIADKS